MILDFERWSLNELYKTLHFKEREQERVFALKRALLPQIVKEEIEKDHSIDSIEEQIKKILIEEMKRRITGLENIKKIALNKTGYPLISPIFNYDGKKYPINLAMESKKIDGSSKLLIGNQIYIPILNQKLITIIPYDYDLNEDEISKKQKNHLERMGKNTEGFQLSRRPSDYVYPLQIVEGKVKGGDIRSFQGIKKGVPQQHELKKGELIGVFVLFLNKIKIGVIDSVVNRLTYIDDGSINVAVKIKLDPSERKPDGPSEIKIVKKLLPGEKIELPVGEKGQMVSCEVLPPGYVQDKRVLNPILKYSKIIR